MSSVKKVLSCVFCQIVEGTSPATIVHQDPKFLAFEDIRPASRNHLLVIPKDHIHNVKSLTSDTVEIINEMVNLGHELVNQKGDINDCRMGFHWPPFNSIGHLHLHVIFPESQISFLGRQIYRPNTFYFVTPSCAIDWIKKNRNPSCSS